MVAKTASRLEAGLTPYPKGLANSSTWFRTTRILPPHSPNPDRQWIE